MTSPTSQGSSSQGLLHNSSYGSLRSPISWFSFPNFSRYCLSFSILCQFSSSFSLFYSSIFPPLYSSFSFSILFKNGFLLYLKSRFLFHFLQFSSIHFQYFWLYFLFPQPYSNFTIYLPGSSLLNIFLSSSASCHLTSSSSSLWYSLLNYLTNSITFFKLSLLSQVSSSAMHPFHCTKYLSFLCTFLLFIIFSTSHSSSPSITTSCGVSFLCPSTCDLYFRTLLTLTTRCILIVLGNYNSIALLEMTAFTL